MTRERMRRAYGCDGPRATPSEQSAPVARASRHDRPACREPRYPAPSMGAATQGDGRRRVVIEGVTPQVDCGRFAAKSSLGERVVVEADAFTDGHDAVRCVLRYRGPGESDWTETPMEPLVNDRWRASFRPDRLGHHAFTVIGWVDHFATWRRDIAKKIEAEQDIAVDLQAGAQLVAAAAARATGPDAER